MKRREFLIDLGVLVCGLLMAFWLGRAFFRHPVDEIYVNHEGDTYVGRLLEFRDQLAAGCLVPQWCTSFRGGLGSAQFCYYQPGFFYVASLVPWSVPAVRALGIAIVGFALLGYVATYCLIRPRFGRLAGWLGAGSLLLSVYAATDIFIRGDLSEFSAMMLLPAMWWALVEWLEQGRLKYAAGLALATAATTLVHPLVSMIGLILSAAVLLAFLLETRSCRRVAATVLVLGLAVGMAAFYWLPVIFELDLVNADKAFAGFYSYDQHFVDLLDLFGGYNREKVIPFSIGLPLVSIAGLNVLACFFRRRELASAQRRLVVFSVLALLGFAWLMTQYSAPVWQIVTPLQRVQFPWRILTVATVTAAVLAGAVLPWRSEPLRAFATASLIITMWALSIGYTDYKLDAGHRVPQSVAELAETYFAPDLCNEWLPRGASLDIPGAYRQSPVIGPDGQVSDFRRQACRLSCHVGAAKPATLVLPHYFFPVGWQATLNGSPVDLTADSRGLMRLSVPANSQGRLEVVFTQTPMRRLGLVVSVLSCLTAGLLWLTLAALGIRASGSIRAPVAAKPR